MINKRVVSFSVIFMALVSLNVFAGVTDNPFRKSLEITEAYLPKAILTMWQSEHLIWRAQLFNRACEENTQAVKHAINAGFTLVNQVIIDQAIINHQLIDENAKLILQDSNKLYYQVFSRVYAYAYTERLRIIQQYHPEISADLCAHAKTISQQYPSDDLPIVPWQLTDQTEFKTWQADLFSMRVVNQHFVAAFIKRQQAFAHIIDAEIYAMMQQNEKAISAFSALSGSYQYNHLLMKEITQAYSEVKGKKLPDELWRASYAQAASLSATYAYKLATISALRQIRVLYPELYQRIEAHTISYVKLQLSRLKMSKSQLNEAFNQHE
ncbi:hypothetical protein [Colwellia sp. MB02u-9]|uniref:hypothetical protein n=1 Tax=Colwellia sp. MB02u-9 TaxID=2759823 RepID=UPI0015F67AAC|nr:hypothetical protein [Colwellia sp. MB02u-9]MBA6297667.1 hypothetical protein [Colwellia sp. MB02u-9]